MQAISDSSVQPCRSVTAAEIAHYQERGWVKLEGFMRPALVRTLLDVARQRLGSDADGNTGYGISQPYFNVAVGGGLTNPPIRALIDQVGRNAKALMGRRGGAGVRYFTDFFAPKLPASKPSAKGGNGATSFHQDFITFGVDRSGGMTFWVALEAYGPESGTMSFLNGSHRMGVLGSYHTYGNGDVLDVFPELRDLEMSEPVSYAIGDVTVHSHLTVHGTSINRTAKPRWAYLVLVQPANACWNGAPSEAFDPSGMKLNQTLDDARFPILA